MAFQAPFSITDMARLQMAEQEQEQARQAASMQNILGAVTSLGGIVSEADQKNQEQRNMFEGNYRFLSERNMLSPNVQNAALDLVGRKDYAAANAYIAPYLAELDFGRKSMLAGRSGFFDANGQWQMAMVPEAVQPRNKYGYRVGGTR
jgi:hypothetical protein